MASLKRRLIRLSAVIGVAAAAVLASAAADAAQPTPAAAELAVTSPPAADVRPVGRDIRRNQEVVLGQRLAAGPGSGIQVHLQDGSQVVIGPNSVLTVDEFSADRVILRLERGSFHVDAALSAHLHVILPNGRIHIRGAAVAGRAGPDVVEVVLLSAGRAEVSGFSGRSVRLDTQGQITQIRALGAPSNPAILPADRLRDFTGMIGQVALRN